MHILYDVVNVVEHIREFMHVLQVITNNIFTKSQSFSANAMQFDGILILEV